MGRPFTDFLERMLLEEDWKLDAACRGKPTEWWYPQRGDKAHRAHLICADCPVRTECDEYATQHRDTHGVWGGVSGRARRRTLQGLPEKPRFVTRKPIAHGTDAGYAAHHRRGEEPCQPCKNAHSQRNRLRQQEKRNVA